MEAIEATLTRRHCWGFPDSALPKGRLTRIKKFPHAAIDAAPVSLWRTEAGRLWISFPRRSWRRDDGATNNEPGRIVLEFCPVSAVTVGDQGQNFGTEITCNDICGACGFQSWVEFPGCADGVCERCHYHG